MENLLEIFNQYTRSELLVLVPVLYVTGKVLMPSKVRQQNIPPLLTGMSILLCAAYTFSTVPIFNVATVLLALFTSVTQGILFAGASILGNVLINRDCAVPLFPSKKDNGPPSTKL